MLISYSHKFIFFHVTKAAGTSVKEALKDYATEPNKFKIKRPPKERNGQINKLYELWQSSLWHAKAKDVKQEFPQEYNDFYKFAFVRNPWDWQVSYYHFILKETTHIRHELVKNMSGGFEEYLEWVIATKNPFPKGATKLQKEIIVEQNGELNIDYLGRYETINEDFNHVCRVLNLQTSLPYLNKSKHRDYRGYYSNRTQKVVADNFQEDTELFDYTFDGYDSSIKNLKSALKQKVSL